MDQFSLPFKEGSDWKCNGSKMESEQSVKIAQKVENGRNERIATKRF